MSVKAPVTIKMNRKTMTYNSYNDKCTNEANIDNSSYENWQQWANGHQFSRRRGRRSEEHDLLSEYVDPTAELHMQIPEDPSVCEKDTKLPAKESKKSIAYQRDHKTQQSSSRRRRGSPGLESARTRAHRDSPEAEEKVEDELLLECSLLNLRVSSSSVSLIEAVSGTSPEGSRSGGDDWSQALGLRATSSLIRQQEEILRQIQGSVDESRPVEGPPNANTVAPACVTTREAITVDHSLSKSAYPTLHTLPCDEESTSCSQTVRLDGRRVKILPESRVERAVECGEQVVLIKCIGCEKKLLATGDMPMIYCPSCGTLSSTEMAKRLAQD